VEPAEAITVKEIDWAAAELSAFLRTTVSIAAVTPVSSRVAAVVQLVVAADGGRRLFFLKRLPSVTQGDLMVLFGRLRSIADAMARRPGLTPYRVVACDPDRRLWLTAAVGGRPLGTLHAAAAYRPRTRGQTLEAWRGLGSWLSTLHWDSLPAVGSESSVAEMVVYCEERFVSWAREDARYKKLADAAIAVSRNLGRTLARETIELTPCHGDVTSYNIIVDGGIGMIDFDDFHYGLPGVDVSQAFLEIDQYSWIGRVVKIPGYQAAATSAFFEGYRGPLPAGARFWLPHLRNLSVYVLTLARRRGSLESLGYWRMRGQLQATLDAIAAGIESADYLRRALTKTRVAR
jgi:Ser/Thr protein kinase RdoA (MazF antagonist)